MATETEQQIDTVLRNQINEQLATFTAAMEEGQDWSARERIRYMKFLNQLTETNEVLQRARAGRVPATTSSK
jgi:hypothetical protein